MTTHPADVLIQALVDGHALMEVDEAPRYPTNRDLLTVRLDTHPCGGAQPWSLPTTSHHATLTLQACAQRATRALHDLHKRVDMNGHHPGLALEARIWHNGRLSIWAHDGHEHVISEHGLPAGQAAALLRSLRP